MVQAGSLLAVSAGAAQRGGSSHSGHQRASGDAASRQSRVVASRAVLETQVRDLQRRHSGGADVPRPGLGRQYGCCGCAEGMFCSTAVARCQRLDQVLGWLRLGRPGYAGWELSWQAGYVRVASR